MDESTKQLLIEKVSAELQIKPEAYTRILAASFPQSTTDMDNLKVAIEKEDYAEIQPLAHRLKGVYGNLRVTEIADPLIEIDRIAKENGSLEEIKEHYSTAKRALEASRQVFA